MSRKSSRRLPPWGKQASQTVILGEKVDGRGKPKSRLQKKHEIQSIMKKAQRTEKKANTRGKA